MNNCRHVHKMKPAVDHSVLNPQKWSCIECSSAENIMACLSCSHVACGRYLGDHIAQHFAASGHPLAIDVHDKYVYWPMLEAMEAALSQCCDQHIFICTRGSCSAIRGRVLSAAGAPVYSTIVSYECDNYVLNDNSAGDIKILRTCLETLSTESVASAAELVPCRRSSRLRRSCSSAILMQTLTRYDLATSVEDFTHADLWFRRYYLLASAFSQWKTKTTTLATSQTTDERTCGNGQDIPNQTNGDVVEPVPCRTLRRRFNTISGVTGLRNLGNTCYMNSILQVLRHVYQFSKVFVGESPSPCQVPVVSSPGRTCSKTPEHSVNGGHMKPCSSQTTSNGVLHVRRKEEGGLQQKSLLHELHSLLRVMWSGRMSMVISPHNMLYAVWNIIPFFRGYSQQDAQEFLSEFLDKVQSEMDRNSSPHLNNGNCHSNGSLSSVTETADDVITQLFQGELVSQVTCLACNNKSSSREPFMDLSLEFPDRYHYRGSSQKPCQESCNIAEMLAKFTEVEKLDGQIYACDHCNEHRRKVSSKPTMYTEAEKCLLLTKLPNILRLHLKRFMWSGRSNRGKISAHVDFATELDVQSYCHADLVSDSYRYKLSAVVMHHGRGFGSGHYTAYCWNDEAGSWLHCNDAKMRMVPVEDVHKAQAYILIYVRTAADGTPICPVSEQVEDKSDLVSSSIARFLEVRKRTGGDTDGRLFVKRRKTTIW